MGGCTLADGVSLSKMLPIGCSMTDLRLLDLDDFIAILLISDGQMQNVVAKTLGLTPPAVSHRIKKWRGIFGDDFLAAGTTPKGRAVVLTESGQQIAARIRAAVEALAS